jgi:predicted  nucleic acid-binding Zn-ribbon protein
MTDESQSRDTLLRLTVPEAASHLGVTQSAIRKRVQRKQIPFDKDERGYTFVYISHDESQSRDRDKSHGTEKKVTGHGDIESRTGSIDELKSRVESLEKHVRFLQEELESRRAEAGRKDALLLNMTEALKVLNSPQEAPPQPREPHISASEEQSNGDVPSEQEKPVSWWRRLFGG